MSAETKDAVFKAGEALVGAAVDVIKRMVEDGARGVGISEFCTMDGSPAFTVIVVFGPADVVGAVSAAADASYDAVTGGLDA